MQPRSRRLILTVLTFSSVSACVSCVSCEGGTFRARRGDGGTPGTAGNAAKSPAARSGRSTTGTGGTTSRLTSPPSKCPSGFEGALSAGHHRGFQSGGQSRSFEILLPKGSFTGPRPLMVAFHGTGLSGALAISSYGLQDWVDDDGFIVVAPDSNGNGSLWPVWDAFTAPGTTPRANADLALFDDLVACVAAHQAVDANRIYVGGQSAGGAMTNYLLGRRSSLVAGGVAESGPFDLTQPMPPAPLDPMMVIVTSGGDNDFYTGSAGSAALANMGYAEQTALSSQYWESQTRMHQIACKGNSLGHVWLPGIGSWMRDVLLAHPKGAANVPGWTMPPLPVDAPVTCSEAAAKYTPPVTVECTTSSVVGCQAYCQLLGDCGIENGTIGPVAAQAFAAIGFAQGANVCSGCIRNCESDAAGSSADRAALSCIAKSAPMTTCNPGLAGLAGFTAIGICCAPNPTSKVCSRYCNAFKQSGGAIIQAITGCP